ncbi:AraD1 family protein [Xanthomonas theicola]|uniref:FAH family protein n=1 Tax=Xanthomonas theicola TaxID=56464 RepID=A0A2S6Z5X3_9XANT|nr:AraD1 family protein [Xanthomonas theicola]PPT76683.1 FAH family protein [Xanthomonas theicola]QNH24454.1 FAH family protein [Xanthomonas theicola]QNH26753.1 FAH family protein [Xanthomonas theicola]
MRLIQLLDDGGLPCVGVVEASGTQVRVLREVGSIYALANAALAAGTTLDAYATRQRGDSVLDYADLLGSGRVLSPLTHPDPAHCRVTGTGLTHLGSAAARDAMHQQLQQQASLGTLTDSMKIFQLGVEGGIPCDGQPGAQPEWFYKGDGGILVAPGAPLPSPEFALDGGEEPELVGLYVIGADGVPYRLGFALGNEFSDHVTERQNYLYLAHSKLRACAVGPELRSGALPRDLRGSSRIRRGDAVIWEKPFVTGEANMCHSLANLEYHHFKYAAHRVPGDVHLHFFGTATLSFADGVQAEPGDRFEIELPALGAALVNPLQRVPTGFALGGVRAL